MEFFCDCAQYCHGVPTKVGRTTYYRHAPFRLSNLNLIQPVDPALVAAHFALISEGDPQPEDDNGDIIMDEESFLNLFNFLLILMHTIFQESDHDNGSLAGIEMEDVPTVPLHPHQHHATLRDIRDEIEDTGLLGGARVQEDFAREF